MTHTKKQKTLKKEQYVYLPLLFNKTSLKEVIIKMGTYLVDHWLRSHLPMQGTQVQSVQEDSTCLR